MWLHEDLKLNDWSDKLFYDCSDRHTSSDTLLNDRGTNNMIRTLDQKSEKTENNHLVKPLVRVGGPKVKDAPTILFRWANIGLIVQTTNFSQMADHQLKGLQLEVGAQRVPRLLVSHIWQSMMLHTLLEKNFNCGSILPHNLIMEGIH